MQLNVLIGKKTYQKQGFLQDGKRVPLTGVVVAGNIITQIKSQDKEGYNSVQLGVETKKKVNSAIMGHVKKALDKSSTSSITPAEKNSTKTITPKYFREVRLEDVEGAILGSEIAVAEVFTAGDMIDVTGVSKGKGWAGGVKRYHFKGGPRTHGQSDRERAPGSIGQTTTPGRVYKGKKMAGRMGTDTVTVKNLEIIEVTNDGVLLIKGLVPGRLNALVMVKKVGENKKFVPLYKEIIEEPVTEEVVSQEVVEAPVVEEQVEVEAPESVAVAEPAVEDTQAEVVSQEPVKEVVEEKVASVESTSEPKEETK
jgi:large subunit ribosomal protein L3